MNSAKTGLPVALADERVGAGWRRSRTASRTVAIVCSLLAAATVFGLFNRFRVPEGSTKPQRELIASVDLSIGNTIAAAGRGEVQARADLEAGLLQLQAFGPAAPTPADLAKAQRLKQRYGVTWLAKGKAPTPVSQAFADGYNRVVAAEVERRHGKDFLDRLMHDSGLTPPDKAEQP